MFMKNIKMLTISVIIILIINTGVASTHEIDQIIATFIVDVTTSLYASSSLTLFHCAETDNIIELSRFMSKNHKLHDTKPITNDYKFDFADSLLAHQNFYVLDLSCEAAYGLLIQANQSGRFIAPTKWLILQDSRIDEVSMNESLQSSELNKDLFEDFDIFPDSEVIIGQRISDNTVRLSSLYRPSPVRSLIVEERGRWSHIDGIQLRDFEVSSRRRTNLQGTPLKACAVVTNPDTMNHLEDFKDKKVDTVTKFGYAFSKLLVARMNARVAFTFSASWGYKEKNGSWSGMIGQIDRNEIDFGATNTFLTSSRIGVVDFIQLYAPNRVRFIFRQPPLSHVSNIFTLPFTQSVWVVIGIFSVIGFALLYMSMAWEWKGVKDVPYEEKLWGDLEIKPAFGDSFLILVGAITQQGSAYEPRSIPARIVIFMLLILCLSLYAAYAANIVALLQSSSDSIKNVEDLMNSPLKIGIQEIVYNRYYLGSFEDPLRKNFYERRIKNQKNIWMPLTDGISRMRNELFAFHVDVTLGYDVVLSTFGEDEKCGFEEIDYLYMTDPAFVIKHRSPYKEIFRVGGIWLEETGLKQRYIRIMYNKKPPCNNQKKFVEVGTVECYAAYLTMGFGMALTFCILIVEIICSKSFSTVENGIIVEKQDAELSAHTSGTDADHEDQLDFFVD